MRYIAALLVSVGFTSGYAAQSVKVPDQKGRVGNWYYISGRDGLFHVPRFVGAVHDSEARTSLVFTCQGRPGAKPNSNAKPMMSLVLTRPIGSPGATTRIRMLLDDVPA